MATILDRTKLSRRAVLRGVAATVATPALASASHLSNLHRSGTAADLLATTVPGGVYINANENPLGLCAEAIKAVTELIPMAGRYDKGMEATLGKLFAEQNGLKPQNVAVFDGSFPGLHQAGLAFSSQDKIIVAPEPTFDQMFYSPADRRSIAPVKHIPLDASYKIDVKKMVAADSTPGIIYICNPNNPTGTIVSKDEIAWVLKNKPAGTVVIVDEAYIHYSDAETALPFVAAGEDIIVSRTFSKIYGMAGLRCGVIAGRADLIEKIKNMGAGNPLPTPALVAALASLKAPSLIAVRRKANNDARDETFAWFKEKGYEYVPSQTNFFMVKVNRPGMEVTKALADKKIFIGGPRTHMNDWVRVSVGTPEEMKKFRTAFHEVMTSAGAAPGAPANAS